MQTFIESKPAIGKSVSLVNLERVARAFNEGEPLSYLQLMAILDVLPEEIRHSLIAPYAAPDSGEIRIVSRLHETGPEYDLQALIQSIERFAVDELELAPDAIHVTGVAVLFNNMLEQLVRSQLTTLLFVILATFTMFVILLRSFKLALIGVVPNLVAAGVILALMGFAGIPLDLMTITIAAIVIGIGVDDAIHYLHRFQQEVATGHRRLPPCGLPTAALAKPYISPHLL